MNGIHQNTKNHNFEELHSGCLGKMANLFELNAGFSPNRLLTNKSHWDGSKLPRSKSATSRLTPFGDARGEKEIVLNFKDSLKGISMKSYGAQGMSKEANSTDDAPNLVAKLMGLDSLPRLEPDPATQRRHSIGTPSPQSLSYQEQKNGFFRYGDPNEGEDFYDKWKQSTKSPHNGRYKEATDDKRMTLVRQKFIEAKRMSMDKTLRQSKHFLDALEVLNLNKDLFLKCLQEPNPTFYHHSCHKQSGSPSSERRRITILRPSMLPSCNKEGARIETLCSNVSVDYHKRSTQPTHIVVLKPSPKKLWGDRKAASTCPDIEDQTKKSRDTLVTEQMGHKTNRHNRDETLDSSVFSNGYIGDQSSFNMSEIESVDCNLSDAECMSLGSRQSCDFSYEINSCSPMFSRASSSRKTSVRKEAKKRLSERWAIVALNGSPEEPKDTWRSPITLGEMLSLSGAKKVSPSVKECSSSQQLEYSNGVLPREVRQDENVGSSPTKLLRSRSVPTSSEEFGAKLDTNIPFSDRSKLKATKEETKKSVKSSSLKAKFSSLFFPRNRKPGKDKYAAAERKNEVCRSPGESCREPSSNASSSSLTHDHGALSETKLAVPELVLGNPGESQNQPSPMPILDTTYEGDEHKTNVVPHFVEPAQHGVEPPIHSMGSNLLDKSPLIGSVARTDSRHSLASNLIDKSPLIGSVSRTRSWDNSIVGPTVAVQQTYEDEKDWFSIVKGLLSAADLDVEVQPNSLLASWHCLESPLDPSLRDKHMKTKGNQLTQKLVFDCVNEALVEITGYWWGINSNIRANKLLSLVDEVWGRMSFTFSSVLDDDNSCILVRNEVAGKGWVDHLRSEMDKLVKEMEDELLEELAHEVVVDQ